MKEEINKEEAELASLSAGESPFMIPDDYFENLPKKVMDQINSLPDYEASSAENPFGVPKGYFNALPDEVISRIQAGERTTLRSWLGGILRPRVSIPLAFAMILLFAGIYFFTQRQKLNTDKQEFSCEDLRNSSYLQTIDEDLLVDYLASQEEINKDDSLVQYLIDNNIDPDQIENEL